jgi:hypothetical protein
MTRDDFIAKHRHELAGLVLDGCTVARSGADLAIFARQIMHKVDARLGAIYAELTAKPQPAGSNGTPAPTKR